MVQHCVGNVWGLFGPELHVGVGCRHVAIDLVTWHIRVEVKTVLGFRREAFKKLGVEVTVFLISVLYPRCRLWVKHILRP